MSDQTSSNKKIQQNQVQEIEPNGQIKKQIENSDQLRFTFNGKNSPQAEQAPQITMNDIKKIKDQGKTSIQHKLTEKQKQMIANLSKIFVEQNPFSKKILIKINEMKRCHLKNQNCEGCPNCRIDSIQIIRLPQSAGSSRVITQFQNTPQISDVIFDLKNLTQIDVTVSQVTESSPIKKLKSISKIQNLKIMKTIAITYKPYTSVLDYSLNRSITQAPFSKFKRYGRETSQMNQSNISINCSAILDQPKSESNNKKKEFIKLWELQELESFVKKKPDNSQLLATSNAANKKLKIQLQKLKQEFNTEKEKNLKLNEEIATLKSSLTKEFNTEKEKNLKLNEEIATLKSSLTQEREIKQVFQRQNNTLKQKLKQNAKLIRELRNERMRNQSGDYIVQEKVPTSLQKMNSNSSRNIQYGIKQSINKQKIQVPLLGKQSNATKNGLARTLSNQVPKQPGKLRTVRSTEEISSRNFQMKSLRVNTNAIQIKNQVKIGGNQELDLHNNSNFMCASNNEGQNQSVSNFNDISRSLSQRVGYIIQKPITQARRGMLFDFMVEQNKQTNNKNEVQRQRFHYKQYKRLNQFIF